MIPNTCPTTPSLHSRKVAAPLIPALLALASFLALTSLTAPAALAAESPQEAIRKSAQDLKEGKVESTLASLEGLADAGIVHPDLSYNRGVAYLKRSAQANQSALDLGQAAAGFAEASHLRPEDPGAKRALREVQELIASKSAEQGTSSENLTLGLGEQLLLWLNPKYLALLGLLGSLATSLGIAFRRSSRESRRTAGNVLALLAGLLLVLCSGGAFLRSSLFDQCRLAVVISRSAPILEESSAPKRGTPALRQGTVVYLSRDSGALLPLVSLSPTRWVRATDLRILAEAP